MKKLIGFLNDCKVGISNVLYFGKDVWKFRAWDNAYTERILLLCLEKQLEEIKNFPYGQGMNQAGAKELWIAVNCLKRIRNREENHPVFDYIEKLYGKSDLDIYTHASMPGYSMMRTKYERDYTPEQIAKIEQHKTQLHKHEDYLTKQDYEMLCKCLKMLPMWWT